MSNYTNDMLYGDQVEALVDAMSVCELTPFHWDLIEIIEKRAPEWVNKGIFKLKDFLPQSFWDLNTSKGHRGVGLIVASLVRKGWIPLERVTPSGKGAPTAVYIVSRDLARACSH